MYFHQICEGGTFLRCVMLGINGAAQSRIRLRRNFKPFSNKTAPLQYVTIGF